MLDIILLAAVALGAAIGWSRGAADRAASAVAMAAGIATWLALPRIIGPLDTGPIGNASASALAGVTTFVIVAYTLRTLTRLRSGKPAWLSRLTGGALGAFQGLALVGVAFAVLASTEPALAASERGARGYPVVSTLAVVLGERAPGQSVVAGLNLPQPLEPADTEPEPAPRPIAWIAIERPASGEAVLDVRRFTGTLEAGERAPLGFEVGGQVARVLVSPGERVDAGQVLAELDPTALRLAVEEREAGLVEAQARLDEAEATFERKRILFERGVESRAAFDTAEAALATARSRVEAARSALDRANDTLGSGTLIAPYDGRIATRLIEPPQVVAAGVPVLEIEGADAALEITLDVPEDVRARMVIGQTHGLIDPAEEGEPVDATVTEIGTRRPGSATFPVTLTLATDAKLRSGMTREVRIELESEAIDEPGITVPAAAVLVGDGQDRFVYAFDAASGTVRRERVAVLEFGDESARIETDLPGGTILATRGVTFLADGQSVELMGVGVARYEG